MENDKSAEITVTDADREAVSAVNSFLAAHGIEYDNALHQSITILITRAMTPERKRVEKVRAALLDLRAELAGTEMTLAVGKSFDVATEALEIDTPRTAEILARVRTERERITRMEKTLRGLLAMVHGESKECRGFNGRCVWEDPGCRYVLCRDRIAAIREARAALGEEESNA